MISLSPGSFGLQLACSLTSSEVGAGFVRVKESGYQGQAGCCWQALVVLCGDQANLCWQVRELEVHPASGS